MPETVTYARSSYEDIINDAIFDTGDNERLYPLPKEELKRWVLLGEKDICEKLPVTDKMELRLIAGRDEYYFADSVGIVGTGTITATGTAIVGTGTIALTELVIGSNISVGGQTRRVTSVTDNTHFTIETIFTLVVTNQVFHIASRSTEIPNEVHQIYFADHIQNARYFRIKVRDIDYILRERAKCATIPTTLNGHTPDVLAPYFDGGRRVLKVFPLPDIDKTICLWTYLRVNPRFHRDEDISGLISLNEMYEPAISEYLRMRIYSFLKDVKEEAKHKTLYDMEIQSLRFALPNDGRVEMEYR